MAQPTFIPATGPLRYSQICSVVFGVSASANSSIHAANSASRPLEISLFAEVSGLTGSTVSPYKASLFRGYSAPTIYYVSSSAGADGNSGLSVDAPWQTLSKVSGTAFGAGAVILFKRGDTWNEGLTVSSSGNVSNRIVYGSYGLTGEKPLFSGFTSVTSWIDLGSNIWESSSAVSTLSSLNMVTINDVNTGMGRWPKTGYFIPTSVTDTSITDTVAGHLNTANWTGAEVVVRTARWHLDRGTISSDSGTTINFPSFGDYSPYSQSGYFLQNHVSTLTQEGDWYYNSSTKKLRMYHVGATAPSGVKVSTKERIVNLSTEDYVTFDNIAIEGANMYGIDLNTRSYIVTQNCDFNFIGVDAIYGYNDSPNCTVFNCTAIECNNIGFNMGSSSDVTVVDCYTQNTGNIAGMGKSGDDSYTGIVAHGDNGVVKYNRVLNAGYCGIKWDGNATVVENNYVDTTTYIKDDGGGIYCYPQQAGPSATLTYTTREVKNNIVLNSIGATEGGAFSSNFAEAMGIYNDGTSPNTIYSGNTVINAYFGIFSNAGHDNTIDGNTVYNCTRGLHYNNYGGFGIANLNVKNNTLVSATTNDGNCGNGQYPVYYEPGNSSMPLSFTASGNCYARPLDQTNGWIWWDFNSGNVCGTLADWQAETGEDTNSTSSPLIVSNISKVRVEYNSTTAPLSVELGSTAYKNIKDNTTKTGTITLQPFTSIILLNTT